MIYEAAVLAQADTNDEQLASIKAIVAGIVGDQKGDILIDEDWGIRALAQPTEKKAKRGRYLYFMYRSLESANAEIDRRLRINENVIRSMVIRLGPDSCKDALLKDFRSPLARTN